MENLLVKEKEIVVPGEELAKGMDNLPAEGTYREEDSIYAQQFGLLNVNGRLLKVIPLSGKYLPKKGDTIIGEVADIGFSGWRVDFGWAFQANLNMRDASSEFIDKKADLRQYFTYGDIIASQITHVSGSKIIDLTMKGPGLKKLKGGKLIKIGPAKVSRVIGKQGSMIEMIKKHTKCYIIVGQNGKVWINGDDDKMEMLAADAIYKIDRESHIGGLTDSIQKFLEEGVKNEL